ncbi:gluconokinase [Deinococcus oregonensis]|uniref:Gluconokinase n=1 Tax=Deinococcus oregonensis TaxID=1805970 RepID=A0ABV6B681_9DEIO
MNTGVVIGLDLGTTAVKAVALDERGEVVARTTGGYALHSGADGSAVQDAEEVIAAALEALASLAGSLGDAPVLALVPSAAMHSLVLLDTAGTVLAPALTWADSRPAATLPSLREVMNPASCYAQTGCPLQAPYHPARLWWLRHHQPELWPRCARFVSLTDLLLYRLTGEWATSVGLASTTGLWNLQTGVWDAGMLETLGIGAGQLPPVYDAQTKVGSVQTGPLKGVTVLAGSSDGALANLGVDPTRLGHSVVTVGTSGAVRRLGPVPSLDPQAQTWSYRLDRVTHLSGGAINNGGLLLDWVRRQWYGDLSTEEGFGRLWSDAGLIPAGAGGLTLLPYLTGERSPHWRNDLSATLHGLQLHHTRAHVARAALEALAFSIKQVWERGQSPAAAALSQTVYSTGGLAAEPLWNSVLASVLGVPVQASEVADASAVGAALLGHDQAGHASSTALLLAARAGAAFPIAPDPAQLHALQEARQRWQSLYALLYGEG